MSGKSYETWDGSYLRRTRRSRVGVSEVPFSNFVFTVGSVDLSLLHKSESRYISSQLSS